MPSAKILLETSALTLGSSLTDSIREIQKDVFPWRSEAKNRDRTALVCQ